MEDIKKIFIVDEKEFDNKNIEKFIRKIVDFIKVGKDGKTFIELDSLTNGDKIALIIVARFLANKLDKSIPQEVSLAEISDSLPLPKNTITARLSELTNKRIVKRIGAGKYIAVSYKIEEFVEKIDKKHNKK